MKHASVFLVLSALPIVCLGYSTADFNRDEIVDLSDFSEFAYQWLQEPESLPEAQQPVSLATYVIAANSALEHVKARADYVCDGADDQIQIQQAVDAMSSIGGTIYLTEGEYYISETITVDKPVFFRGAGVNWHHQGGLTRIYPVDGIDGPIIDSVGSYYLGGIFDIGFDGYFMTTEVNHPAVLIRATGGDYHIERSGFYYLKFLNAVEAQCHNVWIYDTCFEEIKHSSDDCYAVHVSKGVRNRIVNCHFRNNKNCIWFSGTGRENWISGCDFHDTDHSALRLAASWGVISDSFFYRYDDSGDGYPMIEVIGSIGRWSIHDCEVNAYTDMPILEVASGGAFSEFIFHNNRIRNFQGPIATAFSGNIVNPQIKDNPGYATENGGGTLVANGGTIAHELISTPVIVNLTVSDASHIAAVTATDDTNITIGLKDNAGNSVNTPEPVYWYAVCQ